MKTFENKKTEINIKTSIEDENSKLVGYKDLVAMCMNAPREGGRGLSSAEIREDIKLLDKLESLELDESVELEDAEFATLKNYVVKMKHYPIRHKDIVAFEDYVKSIK